jgi:dTDP-4-dehydrorhamnose 3,5-epimerase
MHIFETLLPGVIIIEPDIFQDQRGYFFESYNAEKWNEKGIAVDFVQDNESFSSRGVIRGLHYQLDPYAQSKLVRVVKGAVFDVAVDIRKGSPTYGKWFGTELSDKNKRQMLIPGGFAHGFSVLSATVIFVYKCDRVYSKQAERTILFKDPDLQIDWHLPESEWIISEKDNAASMLRSAEINYRFLP